MNLVHAGVVLLHYSAKCQKEQKKVKLFSVFIWNSPVFHENILGNFVFFMKKYKYFTSYTSITQDISFIYYKIAFGTVKVTTQINGLLCYCLNG
jgi:hypothetical protein